MEKLRDVVCELAKEHTDKKTKKINWNKVSKDFKKRFPKENNNKERLRSLWRDRNDKGYQSYHKTKSRADSLDLKLLVKKEEKKGATDMEVIKAQLKEFLKKKLPISKIAIRLNESEDIIIRAISDLIFEGYDIVQWTEDGVKYAQFSRQEKAKLMRSIDYNLDLGKLSHIKFAVATDLHIGSIFARPDIFKDFVFECYEEGVRVIFIAGDLVEGDYARNRPASIYELVPNGIGFDGQLKLLDEALSKLEGLKYYVITGNHDFTFMRNTGANIGKWLSGIRDDVVYLGHNEAKVYLTDNLSVLLFHATDGIGQNYALKMRQFIDRSEEDRLADFIFMGHYHKFNHSYYKGIHGYILPTFQEQSDYMRNNNLEAIVGGIIFNVRVDEEGKLVDFTPTYKFYE